MNRTRHLSILAGLWIALPVAAEEDLAAKQAFFREKIHPILDSKCFKCHGGEDQLKGHFRVTSRAGLLRGGDYGPGLDEADPAKSIFLEMISYKDDDSQMPPKAKLPDDEIAALTKWIHDGAIYDPALEIQGKAGEGKKGFSVSEEDRQWWAYKPVSQTAPPQVNDADWQDNGIDAFIFSKLSEKGLHPNGQAPAATLIRRIYYDLIGLPPTPEAVSKFETDFAANSEKAWDALIEDLLARPQYGEKWARHWLDLMRYAESNGFERDNPKPHIWRYRDYVVDAFNKDLPYDQFLTEQLAGDEIAEPTMNSLAATGYHRLMQWDDEPADRKQHVYDVLADNVQITSEAFLASTVNCARCHDHKADPISQKDYYSFMSFFHGVTHYQTPGTIIHWASPEEREKFDADKRKRIEAVQKKRDDIGVKLSVFYQEEGIMARDTEVKAVTYVDDNRGMGAAWQYTTQKPTSDWKEVGFINKSWLKSPLGGFGNGNPPNSQVKTTWKTSDIWARTNFGLKDIPSSLTLEIYHDEDVEVYLNGVEIFQAKGHITNYKTITLGKEALDALQTGKNSIAVHCKQTGGGQFLDLALRNAPGGKYKDLPLIEIVRRNQGGPMKNKAKKKYGKDLITDFINLTREIENINKSQAGVPMNVVREAGPNPAPLQVHMRGSAHAPGEDVVPAFLSVLGENDEPTPADVSAVQSEIGHSSGRRLALAKWMTDPDNPLTSRVIANRLWQHHFGRGITASTSDFGRLGEKPTHPELLDWLAAETIRKGWSLKEMHRLMLKSKTYRMSSRGNSENLAADPDNNWFWRFNMRRLTAEEMRDSILAVSGKLNLQSGGNWVYPPLPKEVLATASRPGKGWPISNQKDDHFRRSIYVHVKRSLRHQMLADFDQADTDSPCAVRFATTVPTQALTMLNSRFMNDQAGLMADRLREGGGDMRTKIGRGLQLATQRPATDLELDHCMELIADLKKEHGLDDEQALDRFALLALNLNEFVYLD